MALWLLHSFVYWYFLIYHQIIIIWLKPQEASYKLQVTSTLFSLKSEWATKLVNNSSKRTRATKTMDFVQIGNANKSHVIIEFWHMPLLNNSQRFTRKYFRPDVIVNSINGMNTSNLSVKWGRWCLDENQTISLNCISTYYFAFLYIRFDWPSVYKISI